MSLSDGFRANHGEYGFLGVTSDGYGVYYRERTNSKPERVVVLDIIGTTVDEQKIQNGEQEAFKFIEDKYGWAEIENSELE